MRECLVLVPTYRIVLLCVLIHDRCLRKPTRGLGENMAKDLKLQESSNQGNHDSKDNHPIVVTKDNLCTRCSMLGLDGLINRTLEGAHEDGWADFMTVSRDAAYYSPGRGDEIWDYEEFGEVTRRIKELPSKAALEIMGLPLVVAKPSGPQLISDDHTGYDRF